MLMILLGMGFAILMGVLVPQLDVERQPFSVMTIFIETWATERHGSQPLCFSLTSARS